MKQNMELRHLRYFVAVAEELHFGRAAKRLHIAQPPLSQQIRQLEETLGYPLFVRTSRSVRLTPAGKVYWQRTLRLLRAMEQDVEEMQRVAKGQLGSLHMGFVGSAMLTKLASTLRAYQETHPEVELHLNEFFSSRIVEGLENGSLDIGILRDSDPSEFVHFEPLYAEPFVAVLSRHHALAKRKRILPSALRFDPFVFYPRDASTRAFEKPLSICESFGFRPKITQTATHWLTITRLVGTGMGVTIAPASIRQIAPPECVCISLYGTSIGSQVEIGWRKGEDRPMISQFARIMKKALAA